MSSEYDISRAFKRIENDLIDSMMRNLKRHQVEEAELGIEWEQWQALQLAELEEYRKNNAKLFSGDFSDINDKIDDMFWATYNDAQSAEEHRLMDRIKKGDFRPTEDKGAFFRLNEPKLQALLMATKADFTRAEYAMLRRANDQYRQIIFDSMTYANITNDYAKAVDMATKDFLRAGINSVVYKNGARHNVADYAYMALRTGNKRAYLMGEGNAHDRYGLHTVRVNKRTHACPKCVGFLGRLLIDDVYGGGTRAEATAKGIPTLSDAMQAGFLHPNCKDIYSAYIEGVSQPAKPWTQEEIGEIVGEYNQEQELKHAEDMRESYERMAKYSLDPSNQQTYQTRADNWQARIDEIKNTPPVKPIVPPTGFVSQIQFADGIKQEELIKRLDSEYINHTTQVLHGAHQAGGTADLGGAIRISNSDEATAIHEFAHQIASAYRTKVGLGRDQDTEFWKELKKIHRKYLRETEGDPTRWISTYEHGTRDVSEFMAEAFTQQKMLEYGIPLPSKYGKDTTYSKQVLELIDKHYRRPNIVAEVAEETVEEVVADKPIITLLGETDRSMDFGKVFGGESRSFLGSDDMSHEIESTLVQLQERYPLQPTNKREFYATADKVVVTEYKDAWLHLPNGIDDRRLDDWAVAQVFQNEVEGKNQVVVAFNKGLLMKDTSIKDVIAERAKRISEGKQLLDLTMSNPTATAVHEWGHAFTEHMTNAMIYDDPDAKAYWEWYKSLSKDEIRNGISDYATESRGEFEAECFLELQMPNPRPLAVKWWSYMEKVLAKGY